MALRHSNSGGVFSFLLLMSLVSPEAISTSQKYPSAIFVVLVIWLYAYQSLLSANNVKVVLTNYLPILFWACFYLLACAISLIVNIDLYSGLAEFVRWGLPFPVIQASGLILLLTFAVDSKTSTLNAQENLVVRLLVTFIMSAIPIITILQSFEFSSATSILKFSISNHVAGTGLITGPFATSTDLGSISAIVSIALLQSVVNSIDNKAHRTQVYLELLLLGLYVLVGLLSASRVFILAFTAGFLVFTFQLLRRKKIALTYSLLCLCLATLSTTVHFVNSNLIDRIVVFWHLPYAIKYGLPLSTISLLPNLSTDILASRIAIWSIAFDSIKSSFFWGVSNGGFRLTNVVELESLIKNTHNIFIQVFVDAGIIGFIAFLLMLRSIFKLPNLKPKFPLLATILGSLLVDNFTDHSLPWLIITSYLITRNHADSHQTSIGPASSEGKMLKPWISTATLSCSMIFCLSQYYDRGIAYGKLSILEQMEVSMPILNPMLFDASPSIATDAFAKSIKPLTRRREFQFAVVGNDNLCNYSYGREDHIFLLDHEVALFDVRDYKRLSTHWGVASAKTIGCSDNSPIGFGLNSWIGNYNYYLNEYGYDEINDSLRLSTASETYFSPLLHLSDLSNLTITFETSCKFLLESCLSLSLVDVSNSENIALDISTVPTNGNVVKVTTQENRSGLGYLKLKLAKSAEKDSFARITDIAAN